MMSSSELLINKLSYNYVVYSYKEGISNILKIIAVSSIFALISMIVSLMIGIRKKQLLLLKDLFIKKF